MASLGFSIAGARPLAHAVAPTIVLELSISGGPVASAMLACQIAIEPAARTYDVLERSRLGELPRALVWTHASVVVPAFAMATCLELLLPCPLDYTHAVAQYAGGVIGGALPLVVQLSGTVFHADRGGRLHVAPIPRECEIRFALPVSMWRAAIDHHYPNYMPLAIHRDVAERLHAYRRASGLATIEQALERLLEAGRLA